MGNWSHFCKSWKFNAVFLCKGLQMCAVSAKSLLYLIITVFPVEPRCGLRIVLRHWLCDYSRDPAFFIADSEWCLLELYSAHAHNNFVLMLPPPSDRSLYINCLLNLNPNRQQIQPLPQYTKIFIITLAFFLYHTINQIKHVGAIW